MFNGAGNVPLDQTSINGDEISLSGSGLGTGLHLTGTPTVLGDGRTVRYYVTGGVWQAGSVTVSFAAGSWSDTAGNLGTAGSKTFSLVEPIQAQADGTTPPGKVFFIDISGGMELRLGDLFDEPILEIRGKVSLEIGKDATSGDLRFELTASGTIKVIKLGNLASGAATFVLQTGDSLADTELWGVAAFSTNFDFLHTYGIDLQGHALLEINTTSHDEDRDALARGHPGGVITSFTTPLGALPTDRYNPVALAARLELALQHRPRDAHDRHDRQRPGLHDGDLPRLRPDGRDDRGHRARRQRRRHEWRIKTADGRQWWIDKTTALDGSVLYLFRGEQRTYDLAPKSFEVEVTGGIKIYDVSDPSHVYAQLGGGVLMRITSDRFELFVTAAGIDRRPRLRPRDRPPDRRRRRHADADDPHAIPGVAGMLDVELVLRGARSRPGAQPHRQRRQAALHLHRQRQGDDQHHLQGAGVRRAGGVPLGAAGGLPDAPDDLPLASEPHGRHAGSERAARRRGVPLRPRPGLDHALRRPHAQRDDRLHRRGQRARRRDPDRRRGLRQHPVRRAVLRLDRLHVLRDRSSWARRARDALRAAVARPGRDDVRLRDPRDQHVPGSVRPRHLRDEVRGRRHHRSERPATPGMLATKWDTGLAASDPHGGELAVQTVHILNGLHLTLYGRIATVGNLVVIDGTFKLTIAADHVDVGVIATMTLLGVGQVHVEGEILIDSDGLALHIAASIDVGGEFGKAIGLSFSASVLIDLNTATHTKHMDITGADVPSGFHLHIDGSVTFLGLASASGYVDIAIQGGSFTIQFDVTMHLAGLLDVHAAGGAGIYDRRQPRGMALALDVSIDVSVFDIIKIQAAGKLKLNTSDQARTLAGITIAANSFRLTLTGSISILEVIKVGASFDIIVGGNQTVSVGAGETASSQHINTGEWVFAFTGSLDFFGIVTGHRERLDQLEGLVQPRLRRRHHARLVGLRPPDGDPRPRLPRPEPDDALLPLRHQRGRRREPPRLRLHVRLRAHRLQHQRRGRRTGAGHRQRACVDLVLLLLGQREHVVHARLHRAAEARLPRRPRRQRDRSRAGRPTSTRRASRTASST